MMATAGATLLANLRYTCYVFLIILTLPARAAEDHRAWQHGIELLKVNGRDLLIWSSWGNPPSVTLGGNWEHDIYYSWVDPRTLVVTPTILLKANEAQEPPSTAVNNRGNIFLTWEDGENGINQYAAFWDARSEKIGKKFLVRAGGHSGHTAASKDKFLVAYSEDWVAADDGFLKRGTGKNLLWVSLR